MIKTHSTLKEFQENVKKGDIIIFSHNKDFKKYELLVLLSNPDIKGNWWAPKYHAAKKFGNNWTYSEYWIGFYGNSYGLSWFLGILK